MESSKYPARPCSVPVATSIDSWARDFLRQMFDAAVASADPAVVLPAQLPPPPSGRVVVVGAGKAAGSMAAAVEAAWPDAELAGVVAVPYGYGLQCKRIRVREAAHPVPDANSVLAAQDILAAVNGLGAQDMVLALISGGGSSVMCLPASDLTLEDKQLASCALLASGLDIRTMNAARRRLSAIKGGRLAAAAAPARVVSLAISDIPGDDASAIASGPTAPDEGADIDLGNVVQSLGSRLPQRVRELLSMPGDPVALANAEPVRIIATARSALAGAAEVARSQGVEPIVLGDDLEGEARVLAFEMAQKLHFVSEPTVFISGGETTVTVGEAKAGRGGRNTEFLLALACALGGRSDVWAIAADTDGEDGSNLGAAGAICGPDTLDRARDAGLDPAASLDGHDSGSFFAAIDSLVTTGPTRTNVNDFRAILVIPADRGASIQEQIS